ncbi:MAG: hypothetical protein WBO88_06635, partial [Candidatus Dechloromonas phosphoritropha]
ANLIPSHRFSPSVIDRLATSVYRIEAVATCHPIYSSLGTQSDAGDLHDGWPRWVYRSWLTIEDLANNDKYRCYLASPKLTIQIGRTQEY